MKLNEFSLNGGQTAYCEKTLKNTNNAIACTEVVLKNETQRMCAFKVLMHKQLSDNLNTNHKH